MIELIRSNDPVMLSWVEAYLRDAGVEVVVLDQHMSVLEGSINALSRRLMVSSEQEDLARQLLDEAGVETKSDD
ncbi:MAG: DUF2007 domain-containing protein [Alphaproteobacteria bacterium]|nr:DUF2007 domain-containing protein [Alphaproteobacteria bacterium]MDP6566521.1 DUF2007 domain-containing protein [Alphaproteobacteria bacterium]MDP6812801.1 DUF2007 domain-containing protein [Alphaproteobacteria bacterium]